ncbi:MAG: hypothetical protein WHS38_08795 [Thermodesulforhabdaceae bacterium]
MMNLPQVNKASHITALLLLILKGFLLPVSSSASSKLIDDLIRDQRNFYSVDRLFRIGVAFGIGATMANSTFDEKVQNYYQDHIRNSGSDAFSKGVRIFGDGKYLVPISFALASISFIQEDSLIGDFGYKIFRSYIAGGLPLLATQRLTGAGRPGEHDHGSKWRPLDDGNGVSSHAFIGAVPFLVAARMNDNSFIKYALYAISLAPAFSRINDNAHYFSQAALGWYIAYESTGAVFDTEKNKSISIVPMIGQNTYGVTFLVPW